MTNLYKAILLLIAVPVCASPLDHARVMFSRGNYVESLAAIGSDISTNEARWLKAESLFRLARYKEALEIYKLLVANEKDTVQANKARIRIFECYFGLHDMPNMIIAFNGYQKHYKIVPERMTYAMGKILFDRGYYENAAQLLMKIPLKSDFGMRAHYLVGVTKLNQWSNAQAAQYFANIAASEPVSVEDYACKQLALMAQGRIWADGDDFLNAKKAYEQVSLTGAYGEQATEELVQTLLYWAESLGPDRQYLAHKALGFALEVIKRYRDVKEIDTQNPELLIQMARLLTKTRRYQEAKLVLAQLIERYRTMLGEEKSFSDQHLPRILSEKLPDLSAVRALKNRLDADRAKIVELKDRGLELTKLQEQQQALESQYQQLMPLVQENIKKALTPFITKIIAEAEFRQGEIALHEMQDLRKQLDAVGKFQTEKFMNFEKNTAEIGGSS